MRFCPCERCVVLAICKHKDYRDLMDECELVRNHLYLKGQVHSHLRVVGFARRADYISNLMKARWKIEKIEEIDGGADKVHIVEEPYDNDQIYEDYKGDDDD
jgi:hypothetical protein